MSNDFIPQLFSILNKNYCYVVLRNHENLPQSLDSRDIDILLAPEQFRDFQCDCIKLANENSYKILYTNHDEQFWSVVFGSVEGGVAQLIQLDIMLNLNVMGIILLDERSVLAERLFNGNVYHLPLKYVFLCKFIYSRMLNVQYPEKYLDIEKKVQMLCLNEVNLILSSLLNNPLASLTYWQRHSGRRLLFQAFLASIQRHPLRQFKQTGLFVLRNLLDRFSRRGLFFSLSGPDGSGKTTIINKVIDVLSQVNHPHLFHFRPTLFPNLGEVGVKVKIKEEVDRRFEMPHRGKRNGVINSLIRLIYYMLDYVLGYYFTILPILYRKQIVIFDRYFTDIIVDSERSGIFLNYKYIYLLRYLVPRCSYNFQILVDPEEILKRKQELSLAAINRIYSRLEYLAVRDKSYYRINNNGNSDEAVIQIISTILDRQHRYWYPKFTEQ